MKVMRNFTFIKTVTPDSSPMRPAEGVEDVIMEPSRSAIPAAEAEAVEPGAAPTAADPSVEEAALGDDGSELEDLDGP